MISDEYSGAWSLSRSHHGNALKVYAPGMFVYNGIRGKYQAVSVTTQECALNCEHCKGLLLRSMPKAQTPETLLEYALSAQKRGDIGILVTGACNDEGLLPWDIFADTISEIKNSTNLKVSVHPGQLDAKTARLLKQSGVDQALVDVVGSDKTAREVYHLNNGVNSVVQTMDALSEAGIEIAPHIIFGIHFGRIVGEYDALDIIKRYPLRKYVVVVLNPMKQTPMEKITPPAPAEVGKFLIEARSVMPGVLASLGCARPGGKYRERVDMIAVKAGINSIAVASDKALELARSRGLEIKFESSCCSVN